MPILSTFHSVEKPSSEPSRMKMKTEKKD